MRSGALVILCLLAATGAAGQTRPGAVESDLLTPPDLRAAPGTIAPVAAAPSAKHPQRPARTGSAPPPGQTELPRVSAHPHAPEHPVDLGVVMRGGSATPRLVSPLGSTEAVRESGNAFGAGMRIGF